MSDDRRGDSGAPFRRVLELVERGEEAALATVARSTEEGVEVGAKMIVFRDGVCEGSTGHPGLDAAVVERAVDAIRLGRTARVAWPEGTAAAEVYVEPYTPPFTVVVCGAGHIAVPLATMASFAGFRVTVIDDRAAFANRTRFPTAETVLAKPFEEALAETRITTSTAVVLVTRGHKYDWDCLRMVIGSPAFYIGMIGSHRRVRAALVGLEKQGVDRSRLERVSAPIGLDIGSETPEEIAVAILAEIVMARRGGTGQPLSSLRKRSEVTYGA